MTLGRNEKCWCGSGIKYKKCHLNREKQKPIDQGEAHKFANSFKSKKYCSIPDELKHECSKKIINAHTVSKGSSLAEISDETNHVLGLKISLSSIQQGGGRLSPERIGINQASTFKGFCSTHDKNLFSCVEDEAFTSQENQLFALAFRSLCKEIYAKGSNEELVDFIKLADKGKGPIDQAFIQQLASSFGSGTEAAVNELGTLKDAFDRQLTNTESIELSHFVISSDEPFPVAVSSILCPDVDFHGSIIQDLSDLSVVPECIIFNSFSSDGSGYIVFSWLKGCKIVDSFVETLISCDDRIFDALLRFFFSVSENIYISPKWWHSLTPTQRDSLINRMMIGVSLFEEKRSNYLVDDDIMFEGWAVGNADRINF